MRERGERRGRERERSEGERGREREREEREWRRKSLLLLTPLYICTVSQVLSVKVAYCQLQIQRILRKFRKVAQVTGCMPDKHKTHFTSNTRLSSCFPSSLHSPDFHQRLVTDAFELDVIDEEGLAAMVNDKQHSQYLCT